MDFTLKFIESTFLLFFLAEAGECPNLENVEWNIGDCNFCYCRHGEVFCENTCEENEWFKVHFFFCLNIVLKVIASINTRKEKKPKGTYYIKITGELVVNFEKIP